MAHGKKTNKKRGRNRSEASARTPQSPQPHQPYPLGHAIVYDNEAGARIVLADGITFVNAKGGRKGRTDKADGSFERPFASIAQATEEAGENRTIFLAEGLYREPELALAPGQTLTSRVVLEGHPTRRIFETEQVPLIRPAGRMIVIADRDYDDDDDDDDDDVDDGNSGIFDRTPDGAMLTMRENTELRRVKVEVKERGLAAVVAMPSEGTTGGATRITACHLAALGGGACALLFLLSDGRGLDRVEVMHNVIETRSALAPGLMVGLRQGATLGEALLEHNLIVARGSFMNAAGVTVHTGARLERLDIRDNHILSGWDGNQYLAHGLFISLQAHAEAGEILVRGNNVGASAERSDCLVFNLHNAARAGTLRVCDNRLSVHNSGNCLRFDLDLPWIDGNDDKDLPEEEPLEAEAETDTAGQNDAPHVEETEETTAPPPPGARLGMLCVEGNICRPAPEYSRALDMRLWRGAHLDVLRVSANLIVPPPKDVTYNFKVLGLRVSLGDNTSLDSLEIRANDVEVEGRYVDGLRLTALASSRLGAVLVEDNRLAVTSDEAGCVLFVRAADGLGLKAEPLTAANELLTAGLDAEALRFGPAPEGPEEDEYEDEYNDDDDEYDEEDVDDAEQDGGCSDEDEDKDDPDQAG